MSQPEPDDDQDDVDPYTLTELSNGLEALIQRLDQTEDHFGGALEKVASVACLKSSCGGPWSGYRRVFWSR